MNSQRIKFSALFLAAFAGLACPLSVAAEPASSTTPRSTDPASAGPDYSRSQRSFASADKLRGSKVENANKDNVGSVDDLIIDRGSGAVAYVVLNAGGFLGIGSKSVVIPFSSFGWDPTNRRLSLETTADQVKTWPEYKKDSWRDSDASLSHKLSQEYYRTPTGYYPSDLPTESSRIKGKVTQIDRRAIPNSNGEEMVITVQTHDNRSEQVIVGPTWYMAGNSIAVYRDAPVDIDVTRVQRDGRQVALARSLSVNSRDIPMYDQKGAPHWWNSKGTSPAVAGYPFLLSKELDGKKVEARGERCGKVEDLILECHSGRVAFLSIDPDQNVLGVGDTKRLIPWDVAMVVTDDAVLLDATKAMITNAPQTPKDLNTFATGTAYRDVYSGYGIGEPYYYNRRETNTRPDRDIPDPRSEPAPK